MHTTYELDRPLLSQREKHGLALYRQAQGEFAPAKPGTFFAEQREYLIKEFVRKGLKAFDETQEQTSTAKPR